MSEAFLDAIDDDLAGFLNDWGEVAIYTHDLETPFNVDVIFDSEHELASDGNDYDFDGSSTFVRLNTSEVPDLDYDDTFEIRGITYGVNGIEPDGTGQTVVRLRLT